MSKNFKNRFDFFTSLNPIIQLLFLGVICFVMYKAFNFFKGMVDGVRNAIAGVGSFISGVGSGIVQGSSEYYTALIDGFRKIGNAMISPVTGSNVDFTQVSEDDLFGKFIPDYWQNVLGDQTTIKNYQDANYNFALSFLDNVVDSVNANDSARFLSVIKSVTNKLSFSYCVWFFNQNKKPASFLTVMRSAVPAMVLHQSGMSLVGSGVLGGNGSQVAEAGIVTSYYNTIISYLLSLPNS